MEEALAALQEKLGYRFQSRELLLRALTHKSRAFEAGPPGANERAADNEQLEFLGDAILGFLISELLFSRHPTFEEGRLSQLKAFLVSATHLYESAQNLGLGEYLLLGRGEELSGGREKRALLADATEAIIAAMYMDGGLEVVKQFVLTHIVGEFDEAAGEDESLVVDYKAALQEMTQTLRLPPPRYITVREAGPEHRKTFTVEARVGPELAENADGTSKKAAGQLAAQRMLECLVERFPPEDTDEM
jgi:ribonuclease-3